MAVNGARPHPHPPHNPLHGRYPKAQGCVGYGGDCPPALFMTEQAPMPDLFCIDGEPGGYGAPPVGCPGARKSKPPKGAH